MQIFLPLNDVSHQSQSVSSFIGKQITTFQTKNHNHSINKIAHILGDSGCDHTIFQVHCHLSYLDIN